MDSERKKESCKYCLVPCCKSTSKKNPDKTFISLPRPEAKRKAWLKAVRRDPGGVSLKSRLHVCEDHFNLEEDAENWVKQKYYHRGQKIILKPDVVPHKFDCQLDRKTAHSSKERSLSAKRARQSLVQSLISSSEEKTSEPVEFASPSPPEQPTPTSMRYAADDASQEDLPSSPKDHEPRTVDNLILKMAAARALCMLSEDFFAIKQPDLSYKETEIWTETRSIPLMARSAVRSKVIMCDLALQEDIKQ